jgi:hypothetical protein
MTWPNADDMEAGSVVSLLGIDHVFYDDQMRTGGSASWNNRNPGNIVYSAGTAEGDGAFAGKHNGRFAIFPSEDIGFEAIRRVLRRHPERTILDEMKVYAPAGDGPNDPVRYAEQVAGSLGVGTDTTLGDLGDEQLTAAAAAIRQIEGWHEGESDGPDSLPADLADFLAGHPSRAEREDADQPFAQLNTVGPGVKNIQRRLNELGETPPLTVDGAFGGKTRDAVVRFQSGNGLTPDGIVGHGTWTALVS